MLSKLLSQFFLLALSLFFTNTAVSQQTNSECDLLMPVLKFAPSGSGSWYPYYINTGNHRGIVVDVVEIILNTANICGQEVILPPKRTNLSLKNALVDFDLINPEWLSEKEKSDAYVYSDTVIPIKEHIIYLAGTILPKNLGKDQQLKGQSLGTVRGYYYHNDHLFNRQDYSSEKELVKALFRKRISFAISGDKPALYWAKKLSVPIMLGPIHSDGFLSIRLRKEQKHLLPQINHAIQTLKKNGSISRIIHFYL